MVQWGGAMVCCAKGKHRLSGSRVERGQGLACLEKVASQLKSENSGSQPMMGGWGK